MDWVSADNQDGLACPPSVILSAAKDLHTARREILRCAQDDSSAYIGPANVWRMSMRCVRGPSPPGTGVRKDATSLTLAKSMSPTIFPLTGLMPASSTTAPGLTISAVMRAGRPMLNPRISALRVVLGRA